MTAGGPQVLPPRNSIEEAQSGYSNIDPMFLDSKWVYDCLYCGAVFTQSPSTGPTTGAGNMGRSAGLNVQCPRCGGTNTSGPRASKPGETIRTYQDHTFMVPGLDLFTNQSEISRAESVDGI